MTADQITALDTQASGGDRTADMAWYGRLPGVASYANETGYACTRIVGDTVVIGPAGGQTPSDCANAVTAAIATHDPSRPVRIAVPGIHPLAPTLIESGRVLPSPRYSLAARAGVSRRAELDTTIAVAHCRQRCVV